MRRIDDESDQGEQCLPDGGHLGQGNGVVADRLSYDGPIITGWSALARTEDEVVTLINELRGGES
jgi:hypothetical protein